MYKLKPERKMHITAGILSKAIHCNQGKAAPCQWQNYPMVSNCGMSVVRNQLSSKKFITSFSHCKGTAEVSAFLYQHECVTDVWNTDRDFTFQNHNSCAHPSPERRKMGWTSVSTSVPERYLETAFLNRATIKVDVMKCRCYKVQVFLS